jgi:hypothetical protein
MLIDDVLNDEDLMRIDEDFDLREPLLDGLERSPDAEMQETIQIIEPVEDEEIPYPGQDITTSQEEIPAPSRSRVVRHELGTNHMGQETQALFSTEENEDLSIPNVEITPSPAKTNGVYSNFDTPTSKWLHSLDNWVAQKADRYSVDPEVVWWTLERTGCKRKLAVRVLKYFAEHQGIPHYTTTNKELPEIEGVWSYKDDDILNELGARDVKDLDGKHGYGSAAERKLFLNVWAKSSRDNRKKAMSVDLGQD